MSSGVLSVSHILRCYLRGHTRPCIIEKISQKTVHLTTGELWMSEKSNNVKIQCQRGILWLTVAGDGQDYLLRSGEEFRSPRNGHLVAQGVGDVTFQISSS